MSFPLPRLKSEHLWCFTQCNVYWHRMNGPCAPVTVNGAWKAASPLGSNKIRNEGRSRHEIACLHPHFNHQSSGATCLIQIKKHPPSFLFFFFFTKFHGLKWRVWKLFFYIIKGKYKCPLIQPCLLPITAICETQLGHSFLSINQIRLDVPWTLIVWHSYFLQHSLSILLLVPYLPIMLNTSHFCTYTGIIFILFVTLCLVDLVKRADGFWGTCDRCPLEDGFRELRI